MHTLASAVDLDALLDDIGDRPVVMLGEASHGTHEFYTWRTAISKRLIQEKGFNFIAVEGDWPDCYKINRYVKGYKDGGDNISEVLHNFDRWPTWMWANWEVAALAEWLKEHNATKPLNKKVGFYGLDVYSLWDSMYAMMDYLEKEDPQAAQSVKKAIKCFEPFEENEQAYARYSLTEHSCRDKVLALLKEIRTKAQFLDGDREAGFNTEQNALIAVNAEKYYTTMISFDNESWNVRDRHMMETLDRLLKFHGNGAKGIVWEHNTHIGDARATDMKRAGMVNIGQLAREEYGINKVYLAGFGSYTGTVIAGDEWGAPMQVMDVPEAREGSVEHSLHRENKEDRYLLFNTEDIRSMYGTAIRHRAIGVVYNPQAERYGNYVPSVMANRYDAFIYLDETRALHPLHLKPHDKKMPETYPFNY
ncbi:erythromycin esterase family protein [Flavisolibacter ginsenosidimutans]|uniref:Erythromycin esterase family protein n=1 Tax=Flavisolibacter ginsenosidimutans TaxID=661481 RepID=A0A5B8UEN3_9BACT|nr:erythromycin esterase family protein [Flavisolibacter ginsenosidimutans]QEC54560.1 erythromycin esterase family protein [Flavisolibacter ginsenosidimutans]